MAEALGTNQQIKRIIKSINPDMLIKDVIVGEAMRRVAWFEHKGIQYELRAKVIDRAREVYGDYFIRRCS